MTDRPKKKPATATPRKRKPPEKKKAAASAKPKPGNLLETLDEMAGVIITYVHKLSKAVEKIDPKKERIPTQIDSLVKALKSLDELHARLHTRDRAAAPVNLYFDSVQFDPNNPPALPDPASAAEESKR